MDVASLAIQIKTGEVQKGVKSLDDLTAAGQRAERATDGLTEATDFLQGALRGVVSLYSAQQIFRISDEYTKFTAQLRLATTSQESYNQSLEDVRRISTEAQASLTGTAVLYARISNGTRDLGVTQKQVADITETVSLALKVSGATAEESASAMLQLSQAFASGVLRGEEFNAVNEAAPRLMKALADGLGVPIGQLRNMAQEGLITSEVMAQVLPQSLQRLRDEAQTVNTISGAFQVLKNTMLESIGAAAQATGASEGLAQGISGLAKEIGASEIAFKAFTVLFQTLAVVGSDIAFVFKGVGREIGAIGAQIAALSTGNFEGFRAISEAVKEDAKRARDELDAFQNRVMNLSGGAASQQVSAASNSVARAATQLTKEQLKERQKAEEDINNERIRLQRQRALEEGEAVSRANEEFMRNKQKEHEQTIEFIVAEAERKVQEDYRVAEELAKAQSQAADKKRKEDQELSRTLEAETRNALMRAFEGGGNIAQAFAKSLGSIVFARLSQSIAESLATQAISKLSGGKGGASGGFDWAGAAKTVGGFFGLKFDGGGYTGNGSRSGGLDGKGGFMAMLHPNETVVDHSKGQTMGGVNFAPTIYIDSRSDRGEIMRMVNQVMQNGQAQLVDRLQRQRRLA